MDKIIANEMRSLLVKTLTSEFAAIKQASLRNDLLLVTQLVHKLHGAVCYCDVPELRNALAKYESALKKNMTSALPELFNQVEFEVNTIMSRHQNEK